MCIAVLAIFNSFFFPENLWHEICCSNCDGTFKLIFLKKIELATMVLCWFISGWFVYKVETFTPDIHNFYSKSPLPTSRAFWSSSSRLEILLSFLTTFLLTLILYNLWLNLTTFPTTALCPPHCIVCPLFLSSASCFITRYWSINGHALHDQ